ncbi:GntR family transcriptional regulator [Ramlibacter albus]
MKISEVARLTFRHRIADNLRAAILNGDMPPGTPLVEARLAEQFGVSRGPLREAMRQLTEEGLLTTRAYTGTHVTPLTIQDARDLFALRAALEVFAFEQCWDKRGPEFFAEMKRRHGALLHAIDSGDSRAAILHELELHSLAYETTGNAQLLSVWSGMRGRIQLYWAVHHRVQGGPRREGHDSYVKLACGNDLKAMIREIKAHVRHGEERTAEFLEQLEAQRTGLAPVVSVVKADARPPTRMKETT